jgi:hypothetical protein
MEEGRRNILMDRRKGRVVGVEFNEANRDFSCKYDVQDIATAWNPHEV